MHKVVLHLQAQRRVEGADVHLAQQELDRTLRACRKLYEQHPSAFTETTTTTTTTTTAINNDTKTNHNTTPQQQQQQQEPPPSANTTTHHQTQTHNNNAAQHHEKTHNKRPHSSTSSSSSSSKTLPLPPQFEQLRMLPTQNDIKQMLKKSLANAERPPIPPPKVSMPRPRPPPRTTHRTTPNMHQSQTHQHSAAAAAKEQQKQQKQQQPPKHRRQQHHQQQLHRSTYDGASEVAPEACRAMIHQTRMAYAGHGQDAAVFQTMFTFMEGFPTVLARYKMLLYKRWFRFSHSTNTRYQRAQIRRAHVPRGTSVNDVAATFALAIQHINERYTRITQRHATMRRKLGSAVEAPQPSNLHIDDMYDYIRWTVPALAAQRPLSKFKIKMKWLAFAAETEIVKRSLQLRGSASKLLLGRELQQQQQQHPHGEHDTAGAVVIPPPAVATTEETLHHRAAAASAPAAPSQDSLKSVHTSLPELPLTEAEVDAEILRCPLAAEDAHKLHVDGGHFLLHSLARTFPILFGTQNRKRNFRLRGVVGDESGNSDQYAAIVTVRRANWLHLVDVLLSNHGVSVEGGGRTAENVVQQQIIGSFQNRIDPNLANEADFFNASDVSAVNARLSMLGSSQAQRIMQQTFLQRGRDVQAHTGDIISHEVSDLRDVKYSDRLPVRRGEVSRQRVVKSAGDGALFRTIHASPPADAGAALVASDRSTQQRLLKNGGVQVQHQSVDMASQPSSSSMNDAAGATGPAFRAHPSAPAPAHKLHILHIFRLLRVRDAKEALLSMFNLLRSIERSLVMDLHGFPFSDGNQLGDAHCDRVVRQVPEAPLAAFSQESRDLKELGREFSSRDSLDHDPPRPFTARSAYYAPEEYVQDESAFMRCKGVEERDDMRVWRLQRRLNANKADGSALPDWLSEGPMSAPTSRRASASSVSGSAAAVAAAAAAAEKKRNERYRHDGIGEDGLEVEVLDVCSEPIVYDVALQDMEHCELDILCLGSFYIEEYRKQKRSRSSNVGANDKKKEYCSAGDRRRGSGGASMEETARSSAAPSTSARTEKEPQSDGRNRHTDDLIGGGLSYDIVDRWALLADMYECELVFQRAKCRLVRCYQRMYDHAVEERERRRIVARILSVSRLRVILDAGSGGVYFAQCYARHIETLNAESDLLSRIMDFQCAHERQLARAHGGADWRASVVGGNETEGMKVNANLFSCMSDIHVPYELDSLNVHADDESQSSSALGLIECFPSVAHVVDMFDLLEATGRRLAQCSNFHPTSPYQRLCLRLAVLDIAKASWLVHAKEARSVDDYSVYGKGEDARLVSALECNSVLNDPRHACDTFREVDARANIVPDIVRDDTDAGGNGVVGYSEDDRKLNEAHHRRIVQEYAVHRRLRIACNLVQFLPVSWHLLSQLYESLVLKHMYNKQACLVGVEVAPTLCFPCDEDEAAGTEEFRVAAFVECAGHIPICRAQMGYIHEHLQMDLAALHGSNSFFEMSGEARRAGDSGHDDVETVAQAVSNAVTSDGSDLSNSKMSNATLLEKSENLSTREKAYLQTVRREQLAVSQQRAREMVWMAKERLADARRIFEEWITGWRRVLSVQIAHKHSLATAVQFHSTLMHMEDLSDPESRLIPYRDIRAVAPSYNLPQFVQYEKLKRVKAEAVPFAASYPLDGDRCGTFRLDGSRIRPSLSRCVEMDFDCKMSASSDAGEENIGSCGDSIASVDINDTALYFDFFSFPHPAAPIDLHFDSMGVAVGCLKAASFLKLADHKRETFNMQSRGTLHSGAGLGSTTHLSWVSEESNDMAKSSFSSRSMMRSRKKPLKARQREAMLDFVTRAVASPTKRVRRKRSAQKERNPKSPKGKGVALADSAHTVLTRLSHFRFHSIDGDASRKLSPFLIWKQSQDEKLFSDQRELDRFLVRYLESLAYHLFVMDSFQLASKLAYLHCTVLRKNSSFSVAPDASIVRKLVEEAAADGALHGAMGRQEFANNHDGAEAHGLVCFDVVRAFDDAQRAHLVHDSSQNVEDEASSAYSYDWQDQCQVWDTRDLFLQVNMSASAMFSANHSKDAHRYERHVLGIGGAEAHTFRKLNTFHVGMTADGGDPPSDVSSRPSSAGSRNTRGGDLYGPGGTHNWAVGFRAMLVPSLNLLESIGGGNLLASPAPASVRADRSSPRRSAAGVHGGEKSITARTSTESEHGTSSATLVQQKMPHEFDQDIVELQAKLSPASPLASPDSWLWRLSRGQRLLALLKSRRRRVIDVSLLDLELKSRYLLYDICLLAFNLVLCRHIRCVSEPVQAGQTPESARNAPSTLLNFMSPSHDVAALFDSWAYVTSACQQTRHGNGTSYPYDVESEPNTDGLKSILCGLPERAGGLLCQILQRYLPIELAKKQEDEQRKIRRVAAAAHLHNQKESRGKDNLNGKIQGGIAAVPSSVRNMRGARHDHVYIQGAKDNLERYLLNSTDPEQEAYTRSCYVAGLSHEYFESLVSLLNSKRDALCAEIISFLRILREQQLISGLKTRKLRPFDVAVTGSAPSTASATAANAASALTDIDGLLRGMPRSSHEARRSETANEGNGGVNTGAYTAAYGILSDIELRYEALKKTQSFARSTTVATAGWRRLREESLVKTDTAGMSSVDAGFEKVSSADILHNVCDSQGLGTNLGWGPWYLGCGTIQHALRTRGAASNDSGEIDGTVHQLPVGLDIHLCSGSALFDLENNGMVSPHSELLAMFRGAWKCLLPISSISALDMVSTTAGWTQDLVFTQTATRYKRTPSEFSAPFSGISSRHQTLCKEHDVAGNGNGRGALADDSMDDVTGTENASVSQSPVHPIRVRVLQLWQRLQHHILAGNYKKSAQNVVPAIDLRAIPAGKLDRFNELKRRRLVEAMRKAERQKKRRERRERRRAERQTTSMVTVFSGVSCAELLKMRGRMDGLRRFLTSSLSLCSLFDLYCGGNGVSARLIKRSDLTVGVRSPFSQRKFSRRVAGAYRQGLDHFVKQVLAHYHDSAALISLPNGRNSRGASFHTTMQVRNSARYRWHTLRYYVVHGQFRYETCPKLNIREQSAFLQQPLALFTKFATCLTSGEQARLIRLVKDQLEAQAIRRVLYALRGGLRSIASQLIQFADGDADGKHIIGWYGIVSGASSISSPHSIGPRMSQSDAIVRVAPVKVAYDAFHSFLMPVADVVKASDSRTQPPALYGSNEWFVVLGKSEMMRALNKFAKGIIFSSSRTLSDTMEVELKVNGDLNNVLHKESIGEDVLGMRISAIRTELERCIRARLCQAQRNQVIYWTNIRELSSDVLANIHQSRERIAGMADTMYRSRVKDLECQLLFVEAQFEEYEKRVSNAVAKQVKHVREATYRRFLACGAQLKDTTTIDMGGNSGSQLERAMGGTKQLSFSVAALTKLFELDKRGSEAGHDDAWNVQGDMNSGDDVQQHDVRSASVRIKQETKKIDAMLIDLHERMANLQAHFQFADDASKRVRFEELSKAVKRLGEHSAMQHEALAMQEAVSRLGHDIETRRLALDEALTSLTYSQGRLRMANSEQKRIQDLHDAASRERMLLNRALHDIKVHGSDELVESRESLKRKEDLLIKRRKGHGVGGMMVVADGNVSRKRCNQISILENVSQFERTAQAACDASREVEELNRSLRARQREKAELLRYRDELAAKEGSNNGPQSAHGAEKRNTHSWSRALFLESLAKQQEVCDALEKENQVMRRQLARRHKDAAAFKVASSTVQSLQGPTQVSRRAATAAGASGVGRNIRTGALQMSARPRLFPRVDWYRGDKSATFLSGVYVDDASQQVSLAQRGVSAGTNPLRSARIPKVPVVPSATGPGRAGPRGHTPRHLGVHASSSSLSAKMHKPRNQVAVSSLGGRIGGGGHVIQRYSPPKLGIRGGSAPMRRKS